MKRFIATLLLLAIVFAVPVHAEPLAALEDPHWGASLSDLIFSLMSMPEEQAVFYSISDPDPNTGEINVQLPPASLFGMEWSVSHTYGSAGLCRVAYACSTEVSNDPLSLFYDFTDALVAQHGGDPSYQIDWQDDAAASKYSARIDKAFEIGAIYSISVDIFTAFDPELPDAEDAIWGYLSRLSDNTCSMWFSFEASSETIAYGAQKDYTKATQTPSAATTASSFGTATPTPETPAGPISMKLTASEASNGVKLSWSSVSGAKEYRVSRGRGLNGELSAFTTVKTTSCTDYGWYADVFNIYRVEALSSSGQILGRSSTVSIYGPSRSASNVNPPVTTPPVTTPPVTEPPVTPAPQVWGEWSGWTDIPAYESSTRQVETQWFDFPIVELRYDYSRWRYIGKNGNAWYAPSDYSSSSNYLRGGEWEYTTTNQPKAVTGTAGGAALYEGNWYHETVREEVVGYEQVQLWRYRDLQ